VVDIVTRYGLVVRRLVIQFDVLSRYGLVVRRLVIQFSQGQGSHCAYKLISVYLCAFVGAAILYIGSDAFPLY
jgi:hypothetical protein